MHPMSSCHARRGSLLIFVAGMAGLLASLAFTFILRTRSESANSDAMVKLARAKVLALSAVRFYSQRDPVTPIAAGGAEVVPVNNRDDPRTMNAEWMRFKVGAAPTTGDLTDKIVTITVGIGGTQGLNHNLANGSVPAFIGGVTGSVVPFQALLSEEVRAYHENARFGNDGWFKVKVIPGPSIFPPVDY